MCYMAAAAPRPPLTSHPPSPPQRHKLAPPPDEPKLSVRRAAEMRASVDVLRLSRIVRSNMDKETDASEEGADYDRVSAVYIMIVYIYIIVGVYICSVYSGLR